MSRRRFVLTAGLLALGGVAADAAWLEPRWLKIRRLRLSGDKTVQRLVHFTDLHYKGDRRFMKSVVKTINSLSPDFVCFTGDLIEDGKHLPETLELLSGIESPLFGVPGNHEYWARIPFDGIKQCFAATGGAWLLDEQQVVGGRINLIGLSCQHANQPVPPAKPGLKDILLMHYPAWVKNLGDRKFALMLAGHSHGGQVRIPFFGPLVTPFGVEKYDLGLFQTPAGPLYVNPGIGWFYLPFRFNCRPEVTVIEI